MKCHSSTFGFRDKAFAAFDGTKALHHVHLKIAFATHSLFHKFLAIALLDIRRLKQFNSVFSAFQDGSISSSCTFSLQSEVIKH